MTEVLQRAASLRELGELRAVLVTGKGGVGKTQVTAAIAHALASEGKRVLCGEVAAAADAQSALALAFGKSAAPGDPEAVREGIDLVVLDPTRGHQAFLRDLLKVRMLADAAVGSAPIRRFLAAAPAFPEMGVLYRILELLRAKLPDGRNRYDTLVVDLPATGHALALAQIPGTLLQILPGGPIVDAVREGLDILSDPRKTGSIVVTLPETLPVSEALELLGGIRKHQIPVVGVVLNRMPHNPFDEHELAELEAFAPHAQGLLGIRTVGRIGRARAAKARLAASDGDLLLLPDSLVSPETLPEALAPHFLPVR